MYIAPCRVYIFSVGVYNLPTLSLPFPHKLGFFPSRVLVRRRIENVFLSNCIIYNMYACLWGPYCKLVLVLNMSPSWNKEFIIIIIIIHSPRISNFELPHFQIPNVRYNVMCLYSGTCGHLSETTKHVILECPNHAAHCDTHAAYCSFSIISSHAYTIVLIIMTYESSITWSSSYHSIT